MFVDEISGCGLVGHIKSQSSSQLGRQRLRSSSIYSVAAMLSSQAEARPSTDRPPGDGNYEVQPSYGQQNYRSPTIPPNAAYAGGANGFGPVNPQRQRHGSHQGPGNMSTNGNLPTNLDARNGRDRNRPQENATRDRSQARGTSSNKRSRVCAKCGQQLTGQFVRALDATYHLDCFTCRVSMSTRTIVLPLTELVGLWRASIFQILPSRQ